MTSNVFFLFLYFCRSIKPYFMFLFFRNLRFPTVVSEWYWWVTVQEHSTVRDSDGRAAWHAVQEVVVDISHSTTQLQPTELRQTICRPATTQPTYSRYVCSFTHLPTCLTVQRYNNSPWPTRRGMIHQNLVSVVHLRPDFTLISWWIIPLKDDTHTWIMSNSRSKRSRYYVKHWIYRYSVVPYVYTAVV